MVRKGVFMVYTELTKRAMNIAYNAHHGQYDKGGYPYIHHPIHLAEQMDNEVECCVALLHDVVEDTDITFEDLEREFPSEVIEALKLLTHDTNIEYMDYIKKIKTNEVATKVKLADLKHNYDKLRIDRELTNTEKSKGNIYKEAYEYLSD